MPLHEAMEMLGRGDEPKPGEASPPQAKGSVSAPTFQAARHDAHADFQALATLADELLIELSPLVAIEPLPPRGTWAGISRRGVETLLLDITGIGDWFGGEPELIVAARRWLERFGWSARMAIADTAAAAWGLAHHGDLAISSLPAGGGEPAIDRLPVRALRIDHEVAHQLDRLGIETIGQLRRLPRGGLATRLGPDLIRRVDQMLGQAPEPLGMHHTEPEDMAICELEYPTTDQSILSHRIGLLIDQVSAGLAVRVRGALRLVCELELLENRPAERIEVGLFAPTADAAHLKRLMLTALENRSLAAMVQRIRVSVDLGGPLKPYQTNLFDESRSGGLAGAAGRQAFARMIETVAMRLGGEAVLGVERTDHPRPESAYRLRPLAGRADRGGNGRERNGRGGSGRVDSRMVASRSLPIKSARRSQAAQPLGPTPDDPLRRPLMLLTAPRPIQVEASRRDGVLTSIRIEEPEMRSAARVHRVLRCWGPERIETRGAIAGWERRDYYRVEIEGGGWLWLFRQGFAGEPPAWKLHGRFG